MTNSTTLSNRATTGSVKSSKGDKFTIASSNAKKRSKSDLVCAKKRDSTSHSNASAAASAHHDDQSYDAYSIDRYVEDSANANPNFNHSTASDSVRAHEHAMRTYLSNYEAAASGRKT